ncbi:MAG: hypothetical protein WKH64_02710 [Chloroflexia bacterium]
MVEMLRRLGEGALTNDEVFDSMATARRSTRARVRPQCLRCSGRSAIC